MKSFKTDKQTNKNEYPCLMIYENYKSFIVLFEGVGVGTVVWTNEHCRDWVVGSREDDWCMKYFTLYEGEVVLSND